LCRLPGVEGVYVASGHSCWGILNGPATGEAMAQLICQGKSTTSLAAFDPARFVKVGRRR
jgi:glycine/D-amino acid oxidase-like deaminating enzyme